MGQGVTDYPLLNYDGDHAKLYYYLVDRAQSDAKIGITHFELVRQLDLGPRRILAILQHFEKDNLIEIVKKSKYDLICLPQLPPIPFSLDAEENRKTKLEAELNRLKQRPTPIQSELRYHVSQEKASIIIEMEKDLGRALTTKEAYYLGELFAYYGIERVKTTYRRVARGKNAQEALYAILTNGGSGKRYEKEQNDDTIRYKELT